MTIPTVDIPYGRSSIALALDPRIADWHVVRMEDRLALPDPRAAFMEACRRPVASAPLGDLISPNDPVVVVTSDGTRPLPNHLLIPWLLEALPTPPEQVTVLVGTGTHRPNTPDELVDMFGEEVTKRVRIVNHSAFDTEELEDLGATASGLPVSLNEHYVHGGKRIVLGFIEAHFFAGFSGGAKGVVPGVAGIDTILGLHSWGLIADPMSTWGELEANPIRRAIEESVSLCPPDFMVNVSLNREKDITGIFAGDCCEAHRAGCRFVREASMAAVPRRYPVVVTSNNGYPLDQNLYQTVKGMSAAARIVEPGGTILIASRCEDGIPEHGNFKKMLLEAEEVNALERGLAGSEETVLDQWEAQVLAQVLRHCRVGLLSGLAPDLVRQCLLRPVDDLNAAVADALGTAKDSAVAVLPEGPVTVPYVRGET